MSNNVSMQTTDFITRTKKFVYDDPRDFSFEDYITMGTVKGKFWSAELMGPAVIRETFESFLDCDMFDAFDMVSVAYAIDSRITAHKQENNRELVELYTNMLNETEKYVKDNYDEYDIDFFEHSVHDYN